jgi:hypothetical protein
LLACVAFKQKTVLFNITRPPITEEFIKNFLQST